MNSITRQIRPIILWIFLIGDDDYRWHWMLSAANPNTKGSVGVYVPCLDIRYLGVRTSLAVPHPGGGGGGGGVRVRVYRGIVSIGNHLTSLGVLPSRRP